MTQKKTTFTKNSFEDVRQLSFSFASSESALSQQKKRVSELTKDFHQTTSLDQEYQTRQKELDEQLNRIKKITRNWCE